MQISTKFFDHKFRIVWSKIENVKKIDQIQHIVVKKLLKQLHFQKGVEIHYDGDLPARSNGLKFMLFTVGLLNALSEINSKQVSKRI